MGQIDLRANSLLEALFFGRHAGENMVKALDEGVELRPATKADAKPFIDFEVTGVRVSNGKRVYLNLEQSFKRE